MILVWGELVLLFSPDERVSSLPIQLQLAAYCIGVWSDGVIVDNDSVFNVPFNVISVIWSSLRKHAYSLLFQSYGHHYENMPIQI